MRKQRLAYLAGTMSGIHSELKALEAEGMEGLDPALCSLEDSFGVVCEVLTGEGSAEALARVL